MDSHRVRGLIQWKSRNQEPVIGHWSGCWLWEKHDRIVAAYLFGSTGTEQATAMSDVDIAVVMDGDISLLDELSLSADVAAIL